MAKKTLYAFRAENGIWREELSKKIGVDELTLKEIEDIPEVPQEIAEKVIVAYDLAEDYFTVDPKDKRYKPKKPFKYFLKVALVWELLIGLIFGIVMFPTTLATLFGTGDTGLFEILETLCKAVVIAFSGVYLTSYIVRKTVYGKQITQYDYIYPYLPAQITLCLTILVNFAPVILANKINSEIALVIIGYAIGFIGLIIQGVLTAVLLNSRVEENEKKREKTVKKLSVVAILSSAIYALFCVAISMLSQSAIAPLKLASLCLELGLLILVVFGLVVGQKKLPKFNKIWFTVLPLMAMLIPTLVTAIDMLF